MAPQFRVFVSRKLPEAPLRPLFEACAVDIWPGDLPPTPDELREKSRDCDGIVTLLTDRIDADFLAACPKLKVISNYAVGYNNIDIDAATARGVRVGNTPGVLTEATADIAVSLLLAATRRIVEAAEDAKHGRWKTWEPLGWLGHDPSGKTLGIVGMGRIGAATARRLHFGWKMPVLYTSRTPKADVEAEFGAKRVSMEELLRDSDYVSVHTDLNPSTKHLFGREQFALMKRSAVFVNTSRGAVVDQAALAEALRDGTIFAAGLDVTDPEPLPDGHELYSLRNCTILPHVASATMATRTRITEICVANLLAGLRGGEMVSCVNGDALRG